MLKHASCPVCDAPNTFKVRYHLYNSDLLQCNNCNHYFFETIPTDEELTQHYQTYPHNLPLSDITIKRYNELLDRFEKYRSTNNILDYGCGDGYFLQEAKKRNWNVYGVEFDKKSIEICTAKGINMITIDSITSYTNYFDVVTAFEVIEHLTYPGKFLKIIYNILNINGVFYGTTPNFNSLTRYIRGAAWRVIEYPEHLMYFTSGALKRSFQKNQFKILDVMTTGIDIHEWTKRKRTNYQHNISAIEASRENFESGYRKLIKKCINLLLNLLKCGDSLKWLVQKIK